MRENQGKYEGKLKKASIKKLSKNWGKKKTQKLKTMAKNTREKLMKIRK